jgi:hypothetical protein
LGETVKGVGVTVGRSVFISGPGVLELACAYALEMQLKSISENARQVL